MAQHLDLPAFRSALSGRPEIARLRASLTSALIAGAALGLAACSPARYATCDEHFNGCPEDTVCVSGDNRGDDSRLCLHWCSVPGDCAPDEICDGARQCEPGGPTPAGAPCTHLFECAAEHVCADDRWFVDPGTMTAMERGDFRCRAVCPWPSGPSPGIYSLNAPADDSACPTGEVCVLGLAFIYQQNVCVPPCDPADASSCLDGAVCRYNECVAAVLAAACPDGTTCASGQICDPSTSPGTCLSPVEFDQLHPRPPRAS